jgi:hypothetical protein
LLMFRLFYLLSCAMAQDSYSRKSGIHKRFF